MSNFLSFMALNETVRLSGEALMDCLRRNIPSEIPLEVHQAQGQENAFLLNVGDVPITVMIVNRPLPKDAYENALALDRMWPQAAETIKANQSHAIVAALTEADDHRSAIEAAVMVTIVMAALGACLPALAAIWTESDRIVSIPDLKEAATDALAGRPPVFLWVNLLFLRGPEAPAGNPTIAVLTLGLAPFIGREIELLPVPLSPGEAAGRVLALASYLLSQGPVVRDGETVGLTEDEKIHVRFADEGQRPGVPVMQLSVRT